ncbi:MAG TPA: hypothetical protein VGD78_17730 [Chthoniobacterales bacterium]
MIRSRLGTLFCALAVLQILGGHWALLQTGAWAGMLVQYSQQAGIALGLAKTFDGDHPCPFCQVIKDAKKQEQNKASSLQVELKKDFLVCWSRFEVHQRWAEVKYPEVGEWWQGVASPPAVPPPRNA